jgi:hypothetical protein
MADPALRVVSLGAGVQSTTLLLMADRGEIAPRPDVAIFSDTKWEPKAVYEHLDRLEQQASIPIYRVSAGNIRDDALSSKRSASMPLYVRNEDGSKGQLRRQCTREYKIAPIYRKMRELLAGKISTGVVELWLGISLDEALRMKDARVQWVKNRWPLIEKRMTRHDCLNWLERNGYARPPKSACIGCPYHDRATWRRMKKEDPESWADAVDFDRRARRMKRIDGDAYLLRDLVPLNEADLRNEEDVGQLSFDAECEGMCGL